MQDNFDVLKVFSVFFGSTVTYVEFMALAPSLVSFIVQTVIGALSILYLIRKLKQQNKK